MLPNHFSHEDGKRRPSSRPGSPLTRILRVLDDPSLRRRARQRTPAATLATVVLLCLFFLLRPSFNSGRPKPRRYTGDVNWGDHVALGLGRAKLLDSTPSPYADLGDKLIGGSGPLYRPGRKSRREGVVEVLEGREGAKAAVTRDAEFERDRHGVLGGASVSWGSGIVGMGAWLGETVDMRKDSPSSPPSDPPTSLPAREALTGHILDKAWMYLDAEDQANTEKMLAEAVRDNSMKSLPLRDQVRGDEVASREAALGWSRIYGAMEGEVRKSALEVSVERLVRRVPSVIFSKTTCPHSKRAKALLQKYRLSPSPHIVEVDLRPDGANLKGLLARRTEHATFPNIIIGGRSIGGADDLETLEREGALVKMLEEAGITVH